MAQATDAFPPAQADRQIPLRTQAGGCSGAESGRPGWLGHSPLTLLWDGPGGWVSLPKKDGDTLDGYDPRLGPKMYLEWLKGGLRLPSGRQRKYPHLRHRDPCPPAATELPVTFPPNALPTQTHTNTPIPCAAASRGGGGGGSGLGEEGADFPSRPEVVLLRNSSHQQESQRLPQESFQDTLEVDRCRKGGGRLPGKEVGRAQPKSKPSTRRRFRNWM